MIAVALHHIVYTVPYRLGPLRLFGQAMLAISLRVALVVGLVPDVEAVAVAEVVPVFVVGVVAGAHSVDVVGLHQLDVPFHILAAHHVASKGVVFVAVHALDGHGLAVDAQQAVLDLHRAETNLLLNRLDGNSIFVFQPDCDGVEIRTLCRPRFYAGDS